MSITQGFVSLVNESLEKKLQNNQDEGDFSAFALPRPLPMKIENFIENFLYRLDLLEEIVAHAFLIVEKFLDRISMYNIHKVVFTALTLAYKFCSDFPVANNCLEKIGLLKTGELAKLELIMLEEIQWRIKYLNTEEVIERLIETGKITNFDTNEDEKSNEFEDDETDFTEYESNSSFSELSGFFTY